MFDKSIGHSVYGGEYICHKCGQFYDSRGHDCPANKKENRICDCGKEYGSEHALITHKRMRHKGE